MKITTLAVVALAALASFQELTPAPALAVGDTAPSIRLNDQSGAVATVGGESSTWTVLAFYPKALTPG